MSSQRSPRSRATGRWAIALTAAVAIGSLVMSAILADTPATTRPRAHGRGQLSVASPPAPDIERAEPPPALSARDRVLAARAARRFVSVFLRYETGGLTHSQREALARWSTPGLARALLARPPRAVRGATPAASARVRELALTEVAAGRLQYLVSVRRGSALESFSLTLTGQAGRWRVAAIGD